MTDIKPSDVSLTVVSTDKEGMTAEEEEQFMEVMNALILPLMLKFTSKVKELAN